MPVSTCAGTKRAVPVPWFVHRSSNPPPPISSSPIPCMAESMAGSTAETGNFGGNQRGGWASREQVARPRSAHDWVPHQQPATLRPRYIGLHCTVRPSGAAQPAGRSGQLMPFGPPIFSELSGPPQATSADFTGCHLKQYTLRNLLHPIFCVQTMADKILLLFCRGRRGGKRTPGSPRALTAPLSPAPPSQ